MKRKRKCKKCKLTEGQIGMLEDGAFISDVQYYLGRIGSLKASATRVDINKEGICNICTKGIKNFKPLKERNRSG